MNRWFAEIASEKDTHIHTTSCEITHTHLHLISLRIDSPLNSGGPFTKPYMFAKNNTVVIMHRCEAGNPDNLTKFLRVNGDDAGANGGVYGFKLYFCGSNCFCFGV